ncbi:trace amine-associated receptor 13c-like [Engraulis encrasicolus]|uniref:trace amine-associated receptor 13c-like n=1 Tax=Engraulis encrasicolus TaxID=184585 RepID=UPI002FD2F10A
MVGLFVMPLGFIWMVESCWIFGVSVCAFLNFFAFQLTCASVQNVVLIAVDRYLALSNPFMYTKRVTVRLAVVLSLANWAGSSAGNFALLYCNGFFTTSLKQCPHQCPVIISKAWTWAAFLMTFVFPCSIMFVLYVKIFAIARKHARAIRAANAQGNAAWVKNDNVPKRSERKAAKALGILVFVFLSCVVPYFIASLLADYIHSDVVTTVLNFLSLVLYLNSLCNPVIYALFYPWFQKSMKLILTCRICTVDSSLMQLK